MHAENSLSETVRNDLFPNLRLRGQANLLVMPNLYAARVKFNMLNILGGGRAVGPILVGTALTFHVVAELITVPGLVNMVAFAVAYKKARARLSAE